MAQKTGMLGVRSTQWHPPRGSSRSCPDCGECPFISLTPALRVIRMELENTVIVLALNSDGDRLMLMLASMEWNALRTSVHAGRHAERAR